jgi:hypothetical protein
MTWTRAKDGANSRCFDSFNREELKAKVTYCVGDLWKKTNKKIDCEFKNCKFDQERCTGDADGSLCRADLMSVTSSRRQRRCERRHGVTRPRRAGTPKVGFGCDVKKECDRTDAGDKNNPGGLPVQLTFDVVVSFKI